MGWNETRWFGTPCWTVGITLMPAARGQGCGTEAQRQLVHYLFASTLFNRIEAHTEVQQCRAAGP
ncbi:MAG: GNAT family N-acetyltransferase [Mycobacteriales bacterium]